MNYLQQAYKGENEPWKVILTVLVVSGLFIFNLIFLFFFADGFDVIEEQKKLLELVPSRNFWLAFNLLPFAFLLLFLFLFVKFLHKRSLMSLTTARDKIDWKRVFFSFSLITVITIGLFMVSYFSDPSSVTFQLDPLKFTILVVVSLLLFPLQIGLEEYLFRGYLMQQLAIVVKNRWFPLIVTSVMFGVLHSGNPEVDEMGPIVMIFYIGTGLLLGIMTLMDDGLELALGFHFGNNLMASLLVTSDWSALQTDALFKSTATEASTHISEILIPILIVYPIILLIMAKKYKWKHWKANLFGRVEEPPKEDYKIIGE
ncbi:CPBP family intramembrane glutamic endopeptidase [uncultured Psychroserpens sp.]|uniref:CPBP family intramembrane glutamic endopeptidase n=1 Tax=uncultured Psychroserpens sp. TaxID=255436 RepID=UPI00262E3E7E|nr:CPBP family intramembrane glutamic endopeptidase [uncultured Psychroserpens sp.]